MQLQQRSSNTLPRPHQTYKIQNQYENAIDFCSLDANLIMLNSLFGNNSCDFSSVEATELVRFLDTEPMELARRFCVFSKIAFITAFPLACRLRWRDSYETSDRMILQTVSRRCWQKQIEYLPFVQY